METMTPAEKAAMIAEMNEEVKGMTPAEFNKYLLDIELASDDDPDNEPVDPTTKAAFEKMLLLPQPSMTYAQWCESEDGQPLEQLIIDIKMKDLGIQYTDWCMGAELLDQDLPADWLKAKTIEFGNKVCAGCHGRVGPLNGQGVRPKTYADLWLRIDKMRGIGRNRKTNMLKCDHSFIEYIYQDSGCRHIMINFGS